jgi:hypothetical protein
MKAVFFQADVVFKITKSRKVDADTPKVRRVDKANSIKKLAYKFGIPSREGKVKAVMAIE